MVLERRRPDNARYKRRMGTFQNEGLFPQNVNFMLNLSPSTTGLVDENLAQEFARIGKTFQMPAPLDALPEGWLKR